MRIIGLLVCAFLFFSSLSFAQTLVTKKDSISYAIGISMAETLKKQGMTDLNMASVSAAVEDVIKGEALKIEKAAAEQIFAAYSAEMKRKQSESVIMEGKAYLAENGKKPGVVTTASGLQYEVMVKGAGGPKPAATDRVKTHYHGMLLNGDVFDSSVNRGEPISFGLNQVIKGWTEGLQLMSVGDKFKFTIPSELAYGDRGAGGLIAPHATLVFEVELLGINE
jgi:FKBP-type peptidyl-prolyl cis-trans isomerase FklB